MKKKLLNLIIIAITAIALIVLVYSTSGIEGLQSLFANLKMKWIFVSIAVMAAYWLLDGLILQVICRALLGTFKFTDSLRFSIMGQFFNAITPFSTGGQPLQAYCMIRTGVKPGHSISILIIRSMIFQFSMFIYSVFTFIFMASYFTGFIPDFLWFFLFGLVVNFLLLVLYILFLLNKRVAEKTVHWIFSLLSKMRIIKRPERTVAKIENELESFKEGVEACKGKTYEIAKAFILQIIQYTAFSAIPYCIYMAVEGGRGQFFNILGTQAVLTMITFLVPSPGASGGAEGMSYLFYKHFFQGIHIMPSILIIRIITFYFNIIFGGLITAISKEKPLKKENIGEEQASRDSA